MSRSSLLIALPLCACLTLFALKGAERASRENSAPQVMRLVLPTEALRLLSGEFSSVVSDYMLLEAMVAYSQAQEGLGKEKGGLKADTVWLENMLDAATDLDPLFYDPYYFAAMTLPWDFGNYDWTIRLLEKGAANLKDDWTLPYYAGFHSYYFLKDFNKASKLLFAAAERPGAPKAFLTSLGSRLGYEGNETAVAISFLEKIIEEVDDALVREEFERRLVALRLIEALEMGVQAYTSKLGKAPESLQELVDAGVTKKIPADPYGGAFYLDEDGGVKTTSNMRPMK